MMNIGWQDLVTAGLVVAAAIYLVRRLRRLGQGRQRTGCGRCPNALEPRDETRLISIDPPDRPS